MQIEFLLGNILGSDNVAKWTDGKVMQQEVLGNKLQRSKEATVFVTVSCDFYCNTFMLRVRWSN
jgi:hypothetical protein